MSDFLQKEFYWNTIGEWLIAFAIIVGSVLLGRLVYWLISKVVKKLTSKTKARIDDIIVDKVEEPVAFAVSILGIWYGLDSLNLPDAGHIWINRIYYLLVIFNIAWIINRLLDAFIEEYLQPLIESSENDLDDQLLPILKKGLHFTVWTMAIIVGLNNAGYDVGALIAGLGIGGLAFALAAQDSVANLFGGLTIFLDKPFTVNDRIKVHGFDGIVEEVGIRSSRLRTFEGRLIVIPNKVFTATEIENVSSEPSRRTIVMLGLTYDTSDLRLEEAMTILKEIHGANLDVLEEKQFILFDSFGDFSLNIRFQYYIRSGEDVMGIPSNINMQILQRFNAAKLDFAFPTQTVIASLEKQN